MPDLELTHYEMKNRYHSIKMKVETEKLALKCVLSCNIVAFRYKRARRTIQPKGLSILWYDNRTHYGCFCQ